MCQPLIKIRSGLACTSVDDREPRQRPENSEHAPSTATVFWRAIADFSTWIAILLVVVILQIHSEAYDSDLANDPDESAHFITGVMVFDYCRSAFGSNPVNFAEEYYARYPKVAFGHWPPVFYLVQAAWYAVFDATKASALLLLATITALTTFLLYCRLRTSYGALSALFAIAAFLTLPIVRTYSSAVMSDMLVCLFCLLAIFAFSDLAQTGRWRYAVTFVIWSCLGIFTKGTAFALVPFALLGCVLLRRSPAALVWKRSVMMSGTILLVCVPLFSVAHWAGLDFHSDFLRLASSAIHFYQRTWVLKKIILMTPWIILLVAGLGAVMAIRGRHMSNKPDRHEFDVGVALFWVVSVIIFQTASVVTGPVRYFLPALPALILLYCHGLNGLLRGFATRRNMAVAYVLPFAVTAIAVGMAPAAAIERTQGYSAVASSIPFGKNEPVVLVSSDAIGEGAFLVERLIRDKERNGIVLRASKVMAVSDWFGNHYRLRLKSRQQVRDFLNRVPVRFIVLDDSGFLAKTVTPHHQLLRDTVQSAGDNFAETKQLPICRGPNCRQAGVTVYENLRARDRQVEVVQIDMRAKLGREFTLDLGPNGSCHLPLTK